MRRRGAAAAMVLLLSVAACTDTDGGAETLTVFAAASLNETFTELGEQFEAENEGVEVKFNFDGSSGLAAQINEGAPADVFASADERTMALVAGAGAASGSATIFATNALQIATPPGNPAGITSLADLASPSVKVVLCAPQVPCGAATRSMLTTAGVTVTPVSEEQSVTDVLGKVTSEAADAGLVYLTDVVRAGADVEGVDVPEAAGIVNDYPIVVLDAASDVDLAQQFVDFVAGPDGRAVLAEAGFGAP